MTDREKDVLERRIDELCTEVERLHAEQVYWELGNCPNCPNIVSLQETLEQNDKLRQMNEAMWLIIRCATSHTSAEDGLPVIHDDDLAMLHSMRRELGIEVPE